MDKKVEPLKAHPLADIFPMLSDEGLDDLADDIRANGLRLPILTDVDGRVVDGRNRLEACKRAGVAPRVESVPDGTDVLALIVSLNVKRRNLTASQRAVAAAEAWAQAEADGRVQTRGGDRKSKAQNARLIVDPRDHFAKAFGVGEKYVAMAKELLNEPRAIAKIKAGLSDLKDAHKDVELALSADEIKAKRLRSLNMTRPDLAEKVEAKTLTLEQAIKQAREDEAELKQQRFAATSGWASTVDRLDRDTKFATDDVALFDHNIEGERGGEPITPERLQRCIKYLTAIQAAWRKKGD